jgi:hypothetical protein
VIADLFKHLLNSIPFIAFFLGFGLLVFENIKAHSKIKAVQNKYDPEHLFVKKNQYSSMGLSSNSYRIDRTHVNCTPQFLAEWDNVHGAHWRRIVLLLGLWMVLGVSAKYLRKFLFEFFSF